MAENNQAEAQPLEFNLIEGLAVEALEEIAKCSEGKSFEAKFTQNILASIGQIRATRLVLEDMTEDMTYFASGERVKL